MASWLGVRDAVLRVDAITRLELSPGQLRGREQCFLVSAVSDGRSYQMGEFVSHDRARSFMQFALTTFDKRTKFLFADELLEQFFDKNGSDEETDG